MEVLVMSGEESILGGVRAGCGCYARSEVPKLPVSMPWPPTESNADALEQWIKDYYASSAFNLCEHQALQAMTGPPLKIRVEEGAEPRVVHQPIPLPHHWHLGVLDRQSGRCQRGPHQHSVPRWW